jgi:hypothetical protein
LTELATIGSTIARIGLCVLKLFFEAGATHDASPSAEHSSEKPGTFDNVGVDEIDGEDDAEVVDVSMVLDLGFFSSIGEMEAISSWIATA